MKKLVSALTVLFCGVIIFFSIVSEELYYSTKPKTEIERPALIDDMIVLPESAIFHDEMGDCIFTVSSEQGFSTEILTVTRVGVTSYRPDDTGWFGEGYVFVETEGIFGAPTVVWASEELHDGQRVAMVKN